MRRFLSLAVFSVGMILQSNSLASSYSSPDYAQVSKVIASYTHAMIAQETEQIENLTHQAWHLKTVADEVSLTNRPQDCFKSGASCDLHNTSELELTDLQIHYGNFAVARLDAREEYSATILTLFKWKDAWKIANHVTLNGDQADRTPHFEVGSSSEAVLDAMKQYYDAVEFGHGEPLKNLFHPAWHMKNPEGEVIVAEDTAAFVKRVHDRPSKGYYDNRYTTDLKMIYDRLALLRVDNPKTQSSTLFTYVRLRDSWQMLDKAWSLREQ